MQVGKKSGPKRDDFNATHSLFVLLHSIFFHKRQICCVKYIKLRWNGVLVAWLVALACVKSDPVSKFVLFRPWRYCVGYHTLMLLHSLYKSVSNSISQCQAVDRLESLGMLTISGTSALRAPAYDVEKATCQYKRATRGKCYHFLPLARDVPFFSWRFNLECLFVILFRRRYGITWWGVEFVTLGGLDQLSPTGYLWKSHPLNLSSIPSMIYILPEPAF